MVGKSLLSAPEARCQCHTAEAVRVDHVAGEGGHGAGVQPQARHVDGIDGELVAMSDCALRRAGAAITGLPEIRQGLDQRGGR